jgi:ADP-heptose:LPS heptosyltransferase
MPGHGYVVTLQTILPAQEMADRVRLVGNVDGVVAGDAGLLALASRYGVTVVAVKRPSSERDGLADYELKRLTGLPHPNTGASTGLR